MILPPSIGTTASPNRAVEGFIMIGMHVFLSANGCERMFLANPFSTRFSLGAFDFHGNFDSLSPNLAIAIIFG
jgi:hypothetical protein